MATAQDPVRATPQESYVDAQIAHARGRIRAHDLGVVALVLAVAALAFAVGMVLLDRAFEFTELTRQLALGTFVLAALGYAAVALSKPFRREVNPYYAARLVERSLPGAKNSVVNWLDLRDEPLPPSVHSALGQRAARDLRQADVDAVVRDPRVNWLGWAAGLLFVAALVQFLVLKPGPYVSLLSRAFRPFTSAVIAKRTSLELVKPFGGNTVVAVNGSVDFEVHVGGTVPRPGADDAVRLRLRYNPADPAFEEKAFTQDPADARRWTLRLLANQVQNGFRYRVVGGDDATDEYEVGVRSTPLVEAYDVLYQYRPYLRFRDSESHNPNLEAFRGTRVTLTAHTNRVVEAGRVVFDAEPNQKEPRKPVVGERVEGHPNALRFTFEIERDAKYRVHFQAADKESNQDPLSHAIVAKTDFAPRVLVTQPSPDPVPVNGSLEVAARAEDDFGVTAVRLVAQLKRGTDKPVPLKPKTYRNGKSFQFADGTYPRTLDIKEVLPLELLRSELNLPVAVKTGDVIEYWLEADDNCDYPNAETGKAPNTGRSDIHRVTVADAIDKEEKQGRDEAAQKEKADHERKQDADHRKRDGDKKPDGNPDPNGPGDQPKPMGDQKPDQPPDQKPDGRPNDPKKPDGGSGKPNEGEPGKAGDAKPDAQPPDDGAKGNDSPDDKRIEDIKRKLEKAMRDDAKGDAKPDGQPNDPNAPPKGDAKPDAAPQPNAGGKGDAKPDANAGKAGEQPKGENKPDAKPEPGAAKPNPAESQKPDGQGGEPKAGNQPNPKTQPDAKGSEPKAGQQPGDAKSNPKPDGNAPGEGKSEPKPGDTPGEAKPLPGEGPGEGANKSGDAKKPESAKPEGGANKGGDPKPGDNQGKSEPKAGGNQAKAESKPGDAASKGEPKTGLSKPEGGQGKSEPKPGAGKGEASPKPDGDKGKAEPKPGAGKGEGAPKPGTEKSGEPKPGETKAGEPNAKGESKPGETKAGEPKGDAAKPDGKAGDGQKPESSGHDAPKTGEGDKSPAPGKPSTAPKGQGGEAGSKGSKGEQPNNGPREKGNDNVPKSKPQDGHDRNEGQGKAPSGQASDKAAPKDLKAEPGAGQSKAEPNEIVKGEAKPDPADGKGGNDPNAEVRDATKPHEKPGAKPSAKPKTDGTPAGSPKPGDGKAGGDAKAGPKGNDPSGRGKGEKPSTDELKKASEALKNMAEDLGKMMKDKPPQEKPDAQAMKDAAERLKEFAKQMEDMKKSDPKAFDEIVKNLDEARKNLEKGGGDDLKKAAEDARKAAEEARKAAGEPPPDLPPLPGNQPASKSAEGKQPPDAPPGGTEGGPTGMGGAGSPDNAPGEAPDPRNARRAGELQLEQFKKVDKSVLERLKMTDAEYKQFLAEYEAMLKRKAAPVAPAKDERKRGDAKGNSAANSKAREVKGGPEGKSKLERGGTAQPPPEFRDGYRGFTEDVSKTPKPAEKK